MNTPQELKYSKTHEWSRVEGDTVTVGISDYAQDQLGDVVFVELPKVGKTVRAGDTVAVVESVKTASDIYAPLTGEVIEVNGALETTPETLNESPYEHGWIFKLRLTDASEVNGLLDAAGYQKVSEES